MVKPGKLFMESATKCQCKLSDCSKVGQNVCGVITWVATVLCTT